MAIRISPRLLAAALAVMVSSPVALAAPLGGSDPGKDNGATAQARADIVDTAVGAGQSAWSIR